MSSNSRTSTRVQLVQHTAMADLNNTRCFDPITNLPGDLVALLLSFADVRFLLDVAELVNHAWRDAIDGGLPAIWRDIWLESKSCTGALWTGIIRKSRGRTVSLRGFNAFDVPAQGLQLITTLQGLRVLDVVLSRESDGEFLSRLPLLEELSVKTGPTEKLPVSFSGRPVGAHIAFPPLQHLKSLRCNTLRMVQGLHNLHSVTNLELQSVNAIYSQEPWPVSIRSIKIRDHGSPDIRTMGAIRALPHLTELNTDWTFAQTTFPLLSADKVTSLPALGKHSYLSGFTTLESLTSANSIDVSIVSSSIWSMRNLRKIKWYSETTTDEDLRRLVQLTRLQHVSFSASTALTRQGFHHLGNLPNPTTIEFECSLPLSDQSIYSRIDACANLRELAIFHRCEEYVMSLPDAQAIARLHHLETLTLVATLDEKGQCFEQLCTLRSLRVLRIQCTFCAVEVTKTAMSALSSMTALQDFDVYPIYDDLIDDVADCLVQIPTLRRVTMGINGEPYEDIDSADIYARLRAALPRLEYAV